MVSPQIYEHFINENVTCLAMMVKIHTERQTDSGVAVIGFRWNPFDTEPQKRAKVESVTNSIWHSATAGIDVADWSYLFIHKRSKTCQCQRTYTTNLHISTFSVYFILSTYFGVARRGFFATTIGKTKPADGGFVLFLLGTSSCSYTSINNEFC